MWQISWVRDKSSEKFYMPFKLLAEELLHALQGCLEVQRMWVHFENQKLIFPSLLHIQVEVRANEGLLMHERMSFLPVDPTFHWAHHLKQHVVLFTLHHDLGSSLVSEGKFHLNIVPIRGPKAVWCLVFNEIGMLRIILPAISIVIFLHVVMLEWYPLVGWL